ncbi:uncharacterized protein LOC106656873 [Trichogramma pretiosum]|uniref:uncharacterized protein LOC106656873 n=1 Tax=Trichogramma pretiosum TaxID=7493 RepID=UPI0006C9B8E3|nr:uncharacterized protein LOC106656873 [Trichogramma pretiosum]
MKFTIAFAVLVLVCRAQARAVEDDDDVGERSMVKDQLKVLIDYLTSTLEPALIETQKEVDQVVKQMENATLEASKLYYKHKTEIKDLQDIQTKGLQDLAVGLKYLDVDISECRDKIIRQNVKFTRISNRLKKCIDDSTSIYLKPAKESLKTLNETIVVINEQAKTANKCIDEATLFTSFSAAKCLTTAQLSADVAWLKAPGQIDLSGLKWEYSVLLNKLTECQKQEAYEDLRAEIDSTDREVKNCVIDLVQRKRVA